MGLHQGLGRLGVGVIAVSMALLGSVTTMPASAASSAPERSTAVIDAGVVVAPAAADVSPRLRSGLRGAVFVGNNWDGTADVLDPRTFKRVGRLDVVPDYQRRMSEILTNPYRLGYFLAIRELIGEGHDQLVDDMYSSRDGRMLVVSRPSFGDVVALNVRTRKIVWRFRVAGVRSDHMAVSPDGRRVVISASTADKVHVLRMRDGKQVGSFPSGGSPHESIFIDGGKRILHASIGLVYSPLDQPVADVTKQERVLQIVNARTFKVERRYNLRKALDARGLDKVSTAVRPMTLSPDEKTFYFQLSFFHGFVALDRASGKIVKVRRLPNLVPKTPREQYLLDSAHHGIAANPAGTKLCVAGTMSDYATVVNTRTWRRSKLIKRGLKPYWVTPSADGRYCYISWSGTDLVSRISYRTARIVTSTKVGDHPQRVRTGLLRSTDVRRLPRNLTNRPYDRLKGRYTTPSISPLVGSLPTKGELHSAAPPGWSDASPMLAWLTWLAR